MIKLISFNYYNKKKKLFGSVAQSLDLTPESSNQFDTNKIQASCFFDLLLSMETSKSNDSLKILELVRTKTDSSPSSTTNNSSNLANEIIDDKFSSPQVNQEADNTPNKEMNQTDTGDLRLGIAGKTSNLGVNTLPSSSAGTLNSANFNMNKPTANTSALNNNGINRVIASEAASENYNSMIKALDLCYIEDDLNDNRFAIINAINLCVTVVAYATHANRANQMMIILDAIIPRYLDYLKSETETVLTANSSNLSLVFFY